MTTITAEAEQDKAREEAFTAGYQAAVHDDITTWSLYGPTVLAEDFNRGYAVALSDLISGDVEAVDGPIVVVEVAS